MTKSAGIRLDWPLMEDNITRQDLNDVIAFLRKKPILTQSANVRAFEQEWSAWLGVKHSVFVNSGSSANFVSMAIVRHLFGPGEVIVPTLTWVSDISSVLYNGLTPVFVDVDPRTLGMDTDQVLASITRRTKAVFLTHVLGFNALNDRLLKHLRKRGIPLIEDACESHGATFRGRKVGSFGFMSNFSFYFAHHMSTIEGGMVCTNDPEVYEMARLLRAHGMVREADSEDFKRRYAARHPDLNPKFIFAYPSCNYRSTEINAVMGRSQLKRLDSNNALRVRNFELFLSLLDARHFRTDFRADGSVNYAFVLVLRRPDARLCKAVMAAMDEAGVEYRRGTSGGGNQLRQPYLRGYIEKRAWEKFPEVDHIHFNGFYIGNFPGLKAGRIRELCKLLNDVARDCGRKGAKDEKS